MPMAINENKKTCGFQRKDSDGAGAFLSPGKEMS